MAYSRGVSEGSILFYSGGHNHNGTSSALIATEAYSIYDFIVGFAGSNERQIKQQNNFNNLKTVISNVIKTDVLGPSGVRLSPNSIETIHIVTGAVTAEELSANLVLVNNIISSSNFNGTVAANGVITSQGSSGWAITSAGSAVFSNTAIRGAIVAASLETTGIDISASGNLTAANFALYANGAIYASGGNFQVSAAGILYATGASISGTIVASSVSTPNLTISNTGAITSTNFNVTAGGDLTANNAILYGAVYANGGSIGAWTIDANGIYNTGSGGRSVSLYPATGSVSQTVFEVNYGGWVASVAAGTIRVGAGASQTFMSAGDLFCSGQVSTTTLAASGNISASGTVSGGTSTMSSGAIYSTNTIQAAGAMLAPYFIMSGTVGGTGSALIKRSDGYILVNTSRRELKNNIEDISNSLSKIDALRPRVFNWKPQPDDPDDIFHREIKANHKTMGFVVEELADVSPEYLEYSIKSDGQLDGHYWKAHDFIALAIQGIKDLSAKVTSLEQRIAQLEG